MPAVRSLTRVASVSMVPLATAVAASCTRTTRVCRSDNPSFFAGVPLQWFCMHPPAPGGRPRCPCPAPPAPRPPVPACCARWRPLRTTPRAASLARPPTRKGACRLPPECDQPSPRPPSHRPARRAAARRLQAPRCGCASCQPARRGGRPRAWSSGSWGIRAGGGGARCSAACGGSSVIRRARHRNAVDGPTHVQVMKAARFVRFPPWSGNVDAQGLVEVMGERILGATRAPSSRAM